MVFKDYDIGISTFFITYHALFLVLVPLYFMFYPLSWGLIITTLILIFVCGTSITAGYHRLYAHKTYKSNTFIESILLFFGTLSGQSSVLRWAHDHRLHHMHVDTDKDPYSIKDGFWHAHIIWVLKKRCTFNLNIVSDLTKSKLLAFQDKYYSILFTVTNLLIIGIFGYVFNSYAGAFVLLFLARMFIAHHSTFFINSLAHYWGVKPYSKEHSAVNNWIIALLTFGEGYHNYHHTFASDYRNGIRWYQFDPTKILIWFLGKIGMATDLKKVDRFTIKRKLLMEDKKQLLESINKIKDDNAKKLESVIIELSERINAKLSAFNDALNRYKDLKKNKEKNEIINNIKIQLKNLRQSIKIDYNSWSNICNQVLNISPKHQ